MALTATQNSIIRKTAEGAFIDSWGGLKMAVDMSRFITRFNTTTKSVDFGWFGDVPKPVEWTSARTHTALNAYTDTLTPKKWDLTVDFDVDTFEDDQTGTAAERARSLAAQAADHINYRATQLIVAGVAGTIDTSYDGQFFFDDDHAESGASQDNDFTSAATTDTDPTAAEFELAVGNMYEAMSGFVSDKGNPFGPPEDIEIMVPTQFMKVAAIVLGPTGTMGVGNINVSDSSGVTGVFRGRLKWFPNPHLSAQDTFYGLRPAGAGSVGPLVMNMRKDWSLKVFDPQNSDSADENQVISYRADARYEIGYGLWQKAASHIFT